MTELWHRQPTDEPYLVSGARWPFPNADVSARRALRVAMWLALACSAPAQRGTHPAEVIAEAPNGADDPSEPELLVPEPGCERANWPVQPCDVATSQIERVGVWMSASGQCFAYDGCTVFYRGRPPDDSLQSLFCGENGAIVLHSAFGDPAPFYRARARWEGDELIADTSMGPRVMGRWHDATFFYRSQRMRRANDPAEMGLLDRPILCARRVQPTEDELIRQHGPRCNVMGGP